MQKLFYENQFLSNQTHPYDQFSSLFPQNFSLKPSFCKIFKRKFDSGRRKISNFKKQFEMFFVLICVHVLSLQYLLQVRNFASSMYYQVRNFVPSVPIGKKFCVFCFVFSYVWYVFFFFFVISFFVSLTFRMSYFYMNSI